MHRLALLLRSLPPLELHFKLEVLNPCVLFAALVIYSPFAS